MIRKKEPIANSQEPRDDRQEVEEEVVVRMPPKDRYWIRARLHFTGRPQPKVVIDELYEDEVGEQRRRERRWPMTTPKQQIKQAVEQALEELPAEKVAEVLDFTLFLKECWAKESARGEAVQEPHRLILRTTPASHLDSLTGLVAWGGDAVVDTERLYNDNP